MRLCGHRIGVRRSVVVEARTHGRTVRHCGGGLARKWWTICCSTNSRMGLVGRTCNHATIGIGCNIISTSFTLLDLK